MRKLKYAIIILSISSSAYSRDIIVHPTIPGTNLRDYSQPGVGYEGNNAYPTLPGTNLRDYSRGGVRYEGNNAYPTLPGTNLRDYSLPGWIVDEE